VAPDLQRQQRSCGRRKTEKKGRRAAAAWYASRGEHRSDGLDRPRRLGVRFLQSR
jgi:hypothetical protein